MYVLLFLCAVLPMLAGAQEEGQYFIVAPNVIRVDVDETILVDVQGTPDGVRVPVTLYFQLTGSNQRISETTVSVTKDAPQKAMLRISRDQLILPASSDQLFITLVASANTEHLQIEDRRTILLSYQSGFVFIQTDKPLYTTSQRVDIRIVALDQDMVPTSHMLRVDIVNPDQIIVHRYDRTSENGFVTLQFDFPPHPVFGNWTVVVHYGHQMKVNTSVQFEVKEYALPSFYVEINTQKNYIVPDTETLITHVTARYVFGEPVVGNVLVKYGVFTDEGDFTMLQQKQEQLNDIGNAYTDLVMADVTMIDWTDRLMGKRLFIQACVTDSSSGETINANNTMVTFSRTPYKFNWDLTQRYFKKGLPFAVKANLQYMSGLPAAGIPVAVSAVVKLETGQVVALEAARANGVSAPLMKQLSGPQGELDFQHGIPSNASLLTIHLRTEDPDLSDTVQRSDTFNVFPQESSNEEYLLVRLAAGGNSRQTQQIGRLSSVEVQLTHAARVDTLHYFVIAGGRIVHKGAKTQAQINANTGIGFLITHEMAPSSRVVAYYKSTDTGHIIADAVYMEVEESCENPINLRFENIPEELGVFKTDGNNKNIVLRISANEYTTIGLLAVDKAVFALRNYHRLTQKKVFKRMAGYDLGCGPGGGQTVANIFKDAGVTVMTNTGLEIAHREALGCQSNVRRTRRSISQSDREEIVNKYHGIQRSFCEEGLRQLKDTEQELSCLERAINLAERRAIAKNATEILVFIKCCSELPGGRTGFGDGDEVFQFNQDELLNSYIVVSHYRVDAYDVAFQISLQDVVVRSNFPESWMFTEVETGDNDFVEHRTTLPDSVTTWMIEAIGVSEDYDMCVADPIELQVRPPFFLDVHIPYSVQRFEQIEIIVSVFNYAEGDLQVTVYLRGVEGLCSDALPGDYSKGITIAVQRNKQGTVKFVIVPLEAKQLPVEVVAVTNSSASGHYRDAVRKSLTVRQEGYKQRDTVSVLVGPQIVRDLPQKHQMGGQSQAVLHTQSWVEAESKQVDIIRYRLISEAIPGTHQVHVSLMGNVMGNVIETVLGNLNDLLMIPRGGGEQTMMYLARNVYVYKYLKHTQQFTAALETSSSQYIGDGVADELTHRRSDGSFSVWGPNPSYPSSTWLTAFVTKVMCQAKEFAFIDESITCEAMEWLIQETQMEDGSFQELYTVHHREMTGGVQGEASLTAFVLISLLECSCRTIDKSQSIDAARTYLEQELPALTRPYAIAITAYALAKAKSISANDAIDMLKEIDIYNAASNFRYWGSDDSSFGDGPKPYNQPTAIEVETTSYALLALLEMEDIQYTHAIVNWLTDQENYEGGFVSTQDTVIALQALSQYAIKSQQNNIDIECHVTCLESDFEQTFLLTPDNAIVRQHVNIDVPANISELHVVFQSQGQGIGKLTFESSYHIPEPDSRKCDFELIINGAEGNCGDDPDENIPGSSFRDGRTAFSRGRSGGHSEDSANFKREASRIRRAGGTDDAYIFEYDIQVRYLRDESTGMAIVDVGLYTGYQPITKELEAVKIKSQGLIQHYEVTNRSVIFFLTSIKRTETTCIKFGAQRMFHVGVAQPVAVHVYDYYNPTEECVKFIHPQDGSNILNTLCEGDICVCAAGKCADKPSTNVRDFNVGRLKEKACTSASHFAYEVERISLKRKGTFRFYTMNITTSLKNGLDNVTNGETRTFWKSESCGPPTISKRKRYLVIGSGGLPIIDDNGQASHKYLIDEKMSFYVWPTGAKATKGKKRTISNNLAELKEDLGVRGSGCPS